MLLPLLLLIHSAASLLTREESIVRREVKARGYPFKLHQVTTEDGYLLTVFRIPHGRNSKKSESSVFLMHGVFTTGDLFLAGSPGNCLAYLLADRGYDVWLGNARGNAFSRKHLWLNPDVDKKFWDFSWHEIGVYDLPAVFDYMRNVTKRERFAYVGMSEGSTVFFALASAKPEYNRYITVMVALAPVAYMQHYRSVMAATSTLTSILDRLGLVELLPKPFGALFFAVLKGFCTPGGLFQGICRGLLYSTFGFDPVEMDKDSVPKLLRFPTSVAARELVHYTQNFATGEFRWYDFGAHKNLQMYGSQQPPAYNLSRIAAPAALFYSEGDLLAHPKDAEHICQDLGNCVYKYQVPYRNFNHVDFVIAKHAADLVYNEVFDVIAQYSTQ